MKHWKALLAALLFALALTCAAAAENTVTHTTDENGHAITIVTDENGNQTIISETEPGEDDITFDDGDLDLDDDDAPDESAAPETPAETMVPVTQEKRGSALGWIIPIAVVACAGVGYWLFRRSRKQD